MLRVSPELLWTTTVDSRYEGRIASDVDGVTVLIAIRMYFSNSKTVFCEKHVFFFEVAWIRSERTLIIT